jgi:hypothetical protein
MGATPTDALLLILATWGAIIDSRYKRRGGKKPGKRDMIFFWAAALLLAVPLSVTFVLLRPNALASGFVCIEAATLLFALWELGRWRVRRNNPLSVSA